MKKKREKLSIILKFTRFLVLLIPIFFFILGTVYSDSFYYPMGGVTLLISLIFLMPKLLETKRMSLPHPSNRGSTKKRQKLNISLEYLQSRPISKSLRLPKFKKLPKLLTASIVFWLFISGGFFSFMTIFQFEKVVSNQNILLSFYDSYTNSLERTLLLQALVILFAFVSFLIISLLNKKRKNFIKSILIPLSSTVFVFLIGAHISVLLTLLIGTAHLYWSATEINAGNSSVKILSDANQVADELRSRKTPPSIKGAQENISHLVLISEIDSHSPLSDYYVTNVLDSIPSSLFPMVNIPDSSLVLIGETLFVNRINEDDIETITPPLGKLLVKNQFEPRYIKDEPTVEVMGRQEYLKYREEKINEQVEELQGYLNEVQNALNQAYGGINKAKNMIIQNENGRNEAISSRESAYDTCKNAGYYSYYFGTFYRYYSDSYCDGIRAQWDSIVAGFEQNIIDWKNSLTYYQGQIPQLQEAQESLAYLVEIVESRKEITPQELGIFEPPDHIKIALDSTSNEAINDYLATIIHEYLHYTSYVSGERQLPLYFEEGLTEYFARKALKGSTNIDSNLGYPLIVPVIEEISKKIPEENLLDIYFTKDDKRLIAQLDDVYGDTFYEESEYYFFALSFGGGENMLKVANNIMFKVGGDEIKIENL